MLEFMNKSPQQCFCFKCTLSTMEIDGFVCIILADLAEMR